MLIQSADDMSLAQFWLHQYLRHHYRPVSYSDRSRRERDHNDERYRIVRHTHQEPASESQEPVSEAAASEAV